MVTDPWAVCSSKTDPSFPTNECFAAFEDNFIPFAQQDKLPDSEEYLKTLGMFATQTKKIKYCSSI